MSRRAAGIAELRRDRAARFDLKAIHAAKKESRKVPEKASNRVMAQMQEEMMCEKLFDCACLLTYSSKPKHISQATALFEGLITKDYRTADCRRHLGVLLFLEGNSQEALKLLKLAEESPTDEGPCSGISYQDVLVWAYDQNTEAREKAIQAYKDKVKSGFNAKAISAAKAAYESKDADKSHTHSYASLLSRGSPEQQALALQLFEGLALQGYRKEACLSQMGLVYFMADRLEEAKMYLGEGLSLLKDEDPLKQVVVNALNWTVETVAHLERLEPQRIGRRQQREHELAQERKKREAERLNILKQEDQLRAEGKTYDEITKIMRERQEAKQAAEQERLAKEREEAQEKKRLEDELIAKEKDMCDMGKAKAVVARVCGLSHALAEAKEAVKAAEELEAATEANDDMKQNHQRLLTEEKRAQLELETANEELQQRLSRFTDNQKIAITAVQTAMRRAVKAFEVARFAQRRAAVSVMKCDTAVASFETLSASLTAAIAAERAAAKAAQFAEDADKARASAVAASVECAVVFADWSQKLDEAKSAALHPPPVAKKSSRRKNRPEHWVDGGLNCMDNSCNKKFSQLTRRHHCRRCGGVFCNDCSPKTDGVRLCRNCAVQQVTKT